MSDNPSERRRHPRVAINLPATVAVLMPEDTFRPERTAGVLTDLSLGGLKVAVEGVSEAFYKRLLRELRYAKVWVRFPGNSHETELHGKIVWVHFDNKAVPPACSYGIMFERVTPKATADIEAALAAIRTA